MARAPPASAPSAGRPSTRSATAMGGGGPDAGEAAAACMREMGPPIVTETIMLTAGYLVLCLSGFATLRQFGWLSALTVQICLVGDLVMLPALLTRTRV